MPTTTRDRPPGHQLGVLRYLLKYVRPYRWQIAAAFLALLVAAAAVLAIGQMLRYLVDAAFMQGNVALLDTMLAVLCGITGLLAVAVYWRSYLVAWLGERVTADIRRQVFEHLLSLSPGFFEITRPGEVQSRLTADTTLLQQTVGLFSVIALRNLLLLIGGLIMLAVTSLRLTLLLMLVVPLVILPIVVYGRRVRRLSRLSQDRVADVGAYVDEVVHGIRTVQACGHEAIDRRRYGERVEQAFAAARQRTLARALLAAAATLLIFLAVGVVLWAGGHDVLAGRISEGDLAAFAEAAHAAEFLDELPEGFATFLGEGGVRLSGSQRQRIAIARAILRNPAVLLLDEATSALDAESERLVQAALQKLMVGRTTIIIAHRLATVRGVDRIAVMNRGQLIAFGRHEQLIRQGGLYAHLAALQFGEMEVL